MDEVLADKEGRRSIIELFAHVRADVDTHVTADAQAFGLGQLVMDGVAFQVYRQAATTVGSPTLPRLAGRARLRLFRFGSGGLCFGRVMIGRPSGLAKEQGLVGVEALAAWSVQASQQQVKPVAQPILVAAFFLQRGQQFQDHAFEDDRIVRQRVGVEFQGWSDNGCIRIHVSRMQAGEK